MKFRATILFVFAIAGAMFMTSCTKSYTCQCIISYTGAPGLPDSTVQEYSITDSKNSATSECKAQSATYDNNGIHTVETCVLY